MATYYKYAERSADSQVNWAEVGKGISDMLKEETTIREQKKAAIDQATREFQKTLENAPQGQFQDANKFTNDYAHSMMEQQMIDNRLLKSGQMKLQDFTFRRQNYVDGTSTLFDLQKLYQENYKKKMDGIQSGELQALTGANMASVEGFADFSKSKAVIDPSTGVVNVGIMRPNATTGVLELTNDVAPVNVIKGKILADIPAWKADEVMNNTVKNLGVSMDYIYQAATKTGAGTVTKLLGVGALQGEAAKHPEFKDSIDKANAAINSTIDSYFANDYNISSVLTQNTGKYSQESFTYDKDVAAKDKSKILLKINQSSGLPIIDKSGAHYKEQEQEARQWVRTQLLGKIDDKREIDVTGTIPYGPQPQQWQYQAGQEKKNELAAAGAWNQLYTGKTAAEKKAAADILLGTPNAQAQGLLGVDVSTPGVVKLTYADSKKNRTISMLDTAGKPISLFDFAGTGVELHGVVDRKQAVNAGGGGTGYGALKPEEWRTVKSLRAGETAAAPVVNIMPELFSIKSVESSKSLQNLLGPTFTVTDKGGTWGNDVEVIAPNKEKFIYNANLSKSEAAVKKVELEQFIKVNGAPTGGGGITGGNVR
jgi:hypothetical protein